MRLSMRSLLPLAPLAPLALSVACGSAPPAPAAAIAHPSPAPICAPAPEAAPQPVVAPAAPEPAPPAPAVVQSPAPAVAPEAPDPPRSAASDTQLAASPRVLLVDEPPFYGPRPHVHDAPRPGHRHTKHGHTGRPYHPAPGIIVDVVEAHGGAGAAEVQRAARNLGYWPFRQCYENGLRRNQRLAGKVSLELGVSPGGAVERSVVLGTTLRDEISAACVAREAQGLALPAGESEGSVRLDVSLAVGDEPVPVPRPTVLADSLRDVLRASWDGVRSCYAGKLGDHPTAGGEMDLDFRILNSGQVIEVAEGEPRFNDVSVTRCVLGIYRGMTLPSPHGTRDASGGGHAAQDVSFVYAMHLESTPDPGPEPSANR